MTDHVLVLPDGTVYRGSVSQPVRPVAKARPATASSAKASPADLASRVGNAVVKAQMARNKVAKDLEEAAARWDAQANAITTPVSELKDYYRSKSRSARDKAAALRRGEEVK